ncbi:hypothetical protein HELRODRAFT_185799 [Helobdella robusta]|uniref:Protein phosphatase 1B n=1 Tax=Helobdella robusta TaxID=6412 RepID=T1FNA8_HELRO|nr:hypothetical protein HELRODRAFT_185799 [Helobdella robusta]ESO00112.1 hypothetical protein HELRODRAFT_185799 [Helobdella robusta]
MGAFLDKPKTEKHVQSGSGNGLSYAVSSMQGWRVEMEDAHSAIIGLPGRLKDWSYFAVFDGHAGSRISSYCSGELLQSIITNNDFLGKQPEEESTGGILELPTEEQVKVGIRTGFLALDKKIRYLPETISGEDKSGTTAVCTLVSPTHIFLANCGDSRAVLSRGGRLAIATQDHKPASPAEKERIINAGGSVMIQRVNGSLAVSRALGDFEYKNVQGKGECEQLVSPEPDVFVKERTDDDEFLILACDGIWDVMSNEELCDFVRSRLRLTNDLEAVCNSVIDTCLSKGSRDNMSIILLTFPGAPTVSDEAKANEEELNKRLENKVKEIMQNSPPEATMLQYVMHLLAIEDIEGLPPGGGINAKRDTIEEIINNIASCKD